MERLSFDELFNGALKIGYRWIYLLIFGALLLMIVIQVFKTFT